MTTPLPATEPPLTLYTSIASIRQWRREQANQRKSVAMIPTMGALHAGHASLIRSAARTHNSLVISIFVNPAQFAPHEDLSRYPRTLTADIKQLEALNAELSSPGFPSKGRIEALFVPSVPEMYPSGIPLQQELQKGAFVTVTPLSSRLEGITRPHFFRGVATVCMKLFNILQPDEAYFGQKDVQQTVVLRRMVGDLHVPTKIRVEDTIREEDGLAMSSRNVYLGEKRRGFAVCLYRALKAAEEAYLQEVAKGAAVIPRWVLTEPAEKILAEAGSDEVRTETEYFSVACPRELEELEQVDVNVGAVLSGAVRMLAAQEGEGPVRIIDNIILKGKAETGTQREQASQDPRTVVDV
ncbi:unnamed protein product [Tuber melanosporum]|uniref:Pantoate--beta-alanine ligase n=1 Tax=Tuber melanosporum (strain Mel28) TaxID=656061 RepID=D5GIG8_TUBMM|nr:uncharacterized protein GSTUM_00008493001 [Tuber melanosporum]CAZ84311.1 unnamed protein product [Tuber melanosporum]